MVLLRSDEQTLRAASAACGRWIVETISRLMIFEWTPSLRGESQTLSMLIEAQYMALIVGSVSQIHCVMILRYIFSVNLFQ